MFFIIFLCLILQIICEESKAPWTQQTVMTVISGLLEVKDLQFAKFIEHVTMSYLITPNTDII